MPKGKKKSIKQLKQPTKFHYITKEEQCVLHNLQKQQDIIINPADKGGAVVLWYWDHYTKEAAKQMAEMCYFKMPHFFFSSRSCQVISIALNPIQNVCKL